MTATKNQTEAAEGGSTPRTCSGSFTPAPWEFIGPSRGDDGNPCVIFNGALQAYVANADNHEDARLIAAAPEMLDALKAALPLIDDAVDNMDEQCQAHRDDKKKFERRLNAMESLKMQAAWTREVIAKASGQNSELCQPQSVDNT